MSPDQLHVVAVISNTQRYKTRYRLYQEFAVRMRDAGVNLWTVELNYGKRPHVVSTPWCASHLQLTTTSELWHKENMVNLGVKHLLPHDWQYMAWIDADVNFIRPDWAVETIDALQRYPVVQLMSRISDLNPVYESFQTHKSFGWCYRHEGQHNPPNDCYGHKRGHWHPGFAWAMRRATWDAIGGLYDWAVLGSADRYMAHSYIGDAGAFIEGKGFHPSLVRSVLAWQDRAFQVVKGNVGYVPGLIAHYWHGAKKNRKYIERWDVLRDHQFDPYHDIKYDEQGVLAWTGNKPELERAVTHYFQQRNEDSIDWEP